MFPCALSEWITHQHRDTYASIIGHPPMLSYISVADGESIGRAKFEMCEVRKRMLLFASGLVHRLIEVLLFAENAATLWTAASKRRRLGHSVYIQSAKPGSPMLYPGRYHLRKTSSSIDTARLLPHQSLLVTSRMHGRIHRRGRLDCPRDMLEAVCLAVRDQRLGLKHERILQHTRSFASVRLQIQASLLNMTLPDDHAAHIDILNRRDMERRLGVGDNGEISVATCDERIALRFVNVS